MAQLNWRTINIDALDPDSAANFDLSSLTPSLTPCTAASVQAAASQVRQLLRGGDCEGALKAALDTAPYGGDDAAKDTHLATVMEVLQSTRQADMTPILTRIYQTGGGTEAMDCLMKYIYKGMAQHPPAAAKTVSPSQPGFSQFSQRPGAGEGTGHGMSVLLSWHEKVIEMAGLGCIARVMTDRRTL